MRSAVNTAGLVLIFMSGSFSVIRGHARPALSFNAPNRAATGALYGKTKIKYGNKMTAVAHSQNPQHFAV
jgi:hypothetical protein